MLDRSRASKIAVQQTLLAVRRRLRFLTDANMVYALYDTDVGVTVCVEDEREHGSLLILFGDVARDANRKDRNRLRCTRRAQTKRIRALVLAEELSEMGYAAAVDVDARILCAAPFAAEVVVSFATGR